MTLYYTNPPQYLTDKKPPALVIEAPKENNPWLNLWANLRLASFQGNVTTSGTASEVSGSIVHYQAVTINLTPDYTFVEQVENLRELGFESNKTQIQTEPEEPKKLPEQMNYVASLLGDIERNI